MPTGARKNNMASWRVSGSFQGGRKGEGLSSNQRNVPAARAAFALTTTSAGNARGLGQGRRPQQTFIHEATVSPDGPQVSKYAIFRCPHVLVPHPCYAPATTFDTHPRSIVWPALIFFPLASDFSPGPFLPFPPPTTSAIVVCSRIFAAASRTARNTSYSAR